MSDDVQASNDVARIRELNDRLRVDALGGALMMTTGVEALDAELRKKVIARLRAFDDFNPNNDPHGEHDCATLEVENHRFIWKIDYYDPTLTRHSTNPADHALTRRVLTLMLADEY